MLFMGGVAHPRHRPVFHNIRYSEKLNCHPLVSSFNPCAPAPSQLGMSSIWWGSQPKNRKSQFSLCSEIILNL